MKNPMDDPKIYEFFENLKKFVEPQIARFAAICPDLASQEDLYYLCFLPGRSV